RTWAAAPPVPRRCRGTSTFASLAVDDEPAREDRFVWRRAARAHGLEQRGMEPAPVLIGAFQVQLRRPAQLGPRFEHGGVAAAGVEPDVEDVRLLAKARTTALRTARPGRQQVTGCARVPLVGAVAVVEDARHVLDDTFLEQHRVARVAVERDDRHAPHALARDGP